MTTSHPTKHVTAADSIKALRAALKVAFAGKFSVTMSRGTGHGWAHVTWADGPRVQTVNSLSFKFQGLNFDGMTDSYREVNTNAPTRYSLAGVNHTRLMGPTGRDFISSIFDRAGISDYSQESNWDDFASTFSDARLITMDELSHLDVPVSLGTHPHLCTAQAVARHIHARTDYTGQTPAYDRNY